MLDIFPIDAMDARASRVVGSMRDDDRRRLFRRLRRFSRGSH